MLHGVRNICYSDGNHTFILDQYKKHINQCLPRSASKKVKDCTIRAIKFGIEFCPYEPISYVRSLLCAGVIPEPTDDPSQIIFHKDMQDYLRDAIVKRIELSIKRNWLMSFQSSEYLK